MNHNIFFNKTYCTTCLNNKSKKRFFINKQYYCNNHARLIFNKYIITIQKYYIAYKCRRYIKLYKKLPIDLQHKIIDKINYNHNTFKLYNTIQCIIINKSQIFHNNDMITINKISEIYTLFYKYYNIIHISYLKYYFDIAKKLQLFNYRVLYPETYYFYIDPLYLKITNSSISYDNIINCSNILNKFIIYYIHRNIKSSNN